MQQLRALAFAFLLYLSILIAGIVYLPFLLGPRRLANRLIGLWATVAGWLFQVVVGVRIEYRGLEHRPLGPALVAGKHQSMLDTMAPYATLADPCFVFKKELLSTPFVGWYATKAGMVAVDRQAHATALMKMVRDVRDRMRVGRQVVIFPEGTRALPGDAPDYKPGVAALYRELGMPCHLIATNSGTCWPASGVGYKPGLVVFEYLPPIPAGLKRGEFMRELQARIETASNALIGAR